MNAKFPCRRPVVARPASVRPTLEALDDRLVLSAVGGLGSAAAIVPHPAEVVVTMPTDIHLRRIVLDATTLHNDAVHASAATMSFQWGAGRGIDAANTTSALNSFQWGVSAMEGGTVHPAAVDTWLQIDAPPSGSK
jgi:hypothetical protein